MQYRSFEELPIWQDCKQFVVTIYKISEERFSRDFCFKDQLRRASLSMPLNISEGFERKTNKEFSRFINIAKASAGEVRAILIIANGIGYLPDDVFYELRTKIISISKQLSKFEKYLLNTSH